jgi:signal peptidase
MIILAEEEATVRKSIQKTGDIVTSVLVIAAVLVAVALVGVRLIGLQVYTVLSGSMEPVYHVGSLIYVKDTDYRELEVGDDITFMLNETTIVTHRIVEILPDT